MRELRAVLGVSQATVYKLLRGEPLGQNVLLRWLPVYVRVLEAATARGLLPLPASLTRADRQRKIASIAATLPTAAARLESRGG